MFLTARNEISRRSRRGVARRALAFQWGDATLWDSAAVSRTPAPRSPVGRGWDGFRDAKAFPAGERR